MKTNHSPEAPTNGRLARLVASEPLVFLRRFLRNPRTVGALAPSSRFLARRVVRAWDWEPGSSIVEFGPGTGSFTVEILKRLPAGGRYLGIEKDPVFVQRLRSRFPGVPFAAESVTQLSAITEIEDFPTIDHIVSGLPFASLPPSLIEEVLEAIVRSLRPGGTFTTFQYVHAYPMPSARFFRDRMEEHFGHHVLLQVEPRNFPPALIFTWQKPLELRPDHSRRPAANA